jgi:hypothetical protein
MSNDKNGATVKENQNGLKKQDTTPAIAQV